MKTKLTIILALLISCFEIRAQADYSVKVIKEGLFIPWEIIYGPDDKIWFTQKNGYICTLNPFTSDLDTVYFESNTRIRGEGGMLGMALHPQFESNPYVYVAYEYENGNNYRERIVRYNYDGVALGSPEILLDNIIGGNIHNGCRLLIVGDKLYISTGDAGNTSHSQNLASVNGKTLRINLDGSIPDDNPIAGSPVWNWGQRNVQGMVYANGTFYSSMHGASADDEINLLTAGGNYGWPQIEGYCDEAFEMNFCADSNVIEPIHAWTPTIAVAGMDYYNHDMFPAWQNSLLLVTLKDESFYQLRLNASHDAIETITRIEMDYGRLRDIAVSPDGRIFMSTSNSNANGNGSHIDRIIMLYDPLSEVYDTEDPLAMTLFPNPVQTDLYIDWEARRGEWGHFVVYDLQGSKLQEQILHIPARLDMREYRPGIYVVQCEDNNGQVVTKKVMKK